MLESICRTIWDERGKHPDKSRIFNRSGTDRFKTRTFQKTRPDTSIGAEKEEVSGETQTYGNPTQICSRHIMDTVSEFHKEAPQATVGEGLAQGPYVAARARFEPVTLRMKGIESANEPTRPTTYILLYMHT